MEYATPLGPSSPPARPVACGSGFAFYHDAPGGTGYVICGSFGYDEICSRKFLRLIGEERAADGAPVVRIDYPGTLNMPDDASETTLEGWVDHAVIAAQTLKDLSAATRIVFFGFGIGSAVAFLAAARRDDTKALILAAPPPSGRRYLRELKLQAQVADETLGLDLTNPDLETGYSGFAMPARLETSLKAFKLSPDGISPPEKTLIIHRPGSEPEHSFAKTLETAGWPVETAAFEGYHELLASPTTSVLPRKVMDLIARFAGTLAQTSASPLEGASSTSSCKGRSLPAKPVLAGEGFEETPVRFGQNENFFGVLTRPTCPRTGPLMIFLNTGYGHHAGWGRIYVRAARQLAQSGIASLRFDMAGIGESPAIPGRPEQVLYTDEQLADVAAALDFLKSEEPGPYYLIGRCSGAYVALHAAARYKDVAGAMLVNQLRLIWDPEQNVFDALNFGARPLAEYKRRAISLETFRRLLRGGVDVRRAAGHISAHVKDRFMRRAAPYLGRLTKLGRFQGKCRDLFSTMAERTMPLHIMNSEIDGSLDELQRYFRADLGGLTAYPNVSHAMIPASDHNLTPDHAQRFLIETLERIGSDPYWAGSGTAKTD